MAKTRMLKPDLRTSEKVASWPLEVRYFWVLLWGYVDDHGKGKDNPLLVKADCFPLDPDITGETINAWLDRLALDAVITRYEVDGARLLKVVHWSEHQKPQHPGPDNFPGPDDPGAVSCNPHEGFMNDARTPHEGRTPELSRGGDELRGGDAQAASQPPSPFCARHPNGTDKACGPCGDSRRAHDDWLRNPPPVLQLVPKVRHIEGLCDTHRQPEDTCEMCAYERTHPIDTYAGSLA